MSPSILVVARWYPSHDQPGRGTFVADLVRALSAAGADVVVASFETTQFRAGAGDPSAAIAAAESAWARAVADPDAVARPRSWGAAGVPVARLPVIRTWATGPDFDRVEQANRHAAMLRPFVRALAARTPIDVIHAHTGLPDGLAAAAAAADLDVPLLVSEHDSTLIGRLDVDSAARAAYRGLLDGGRRVVAVSPPLAAALTDRLAPSEPIGVIANPVPTDAFPLGADAERDPDELLWVGARAEHKGTDRLLRAFALARAQRPGLRLRMIGAAPDGDDDRWSRLADELAVTDAVAIEPAVDRAGVATAMRRAGLFVHPSPFETFGMVAAEALASGLPVVATPSGGVDAIVGRDGIAGEIAASLEPEALAAAIATALERRLAFRPDALRALVVERYGAAVVAAAMLAAYEALLANRPARASSADATEPVARGRPRRTAAVVALRRSGIRRVEGLPDAARDGLTVVTNPAPARELTTAVGRVVIPTDLGPPRSGRLGRLVRAVVGGDRRPGDGDDGRDATAEAIRSAAGAEPGWYVAADGDDVEPILRAAGASSLAPGSLRWLADRSDDPGERHGTMIR